MIGAGRAWGTRPPHAGAARRQGPGRSRPPARSWGPRASRPAATSSRRRHRHVGHQRLGHRAPGRQLLPHGHRVRRPRPRLRQRPVPAHHRHLRQRPLGRARRRPQGPAAWTTATRRSSGASLLVRLRRAHHRSVEGDGGRRAVGDTVSVVPAHVDPTVAYHERLHVVQGEEVVDEWAVDLRAGSRRPRSASCASGWRRHQRPRRPRGAHRARRATTSRARSTTTSAPTATRSTIEAEHNAWASRRPRGSWRSPRSCGRPTSRQFEFVVIDLDGDEVAFDRGQLRERFGPGIRRSSENTFDDEVRPVPRAMLHRRHRRGRPAPWRIVHDRGRARGRGRSDRRPTARARHRATATPARSATRVSGLSRRADPPTSGTPGPGGRMASFSAAVELGEGAAVADLDRRPRSGRSPKPPSPCGAVGDDALGLDPHHRLAPSGRATAAAHTVAARRRRRRHPVELPQHARDPVGLLGPPGRVDAGPAADGVDHDAGVVGHGRARRWRSRTLHRALRRALASNVAPGLLDGGVVGRLPPPARRWRRSR